MTPPVGGREREGGFVLALVVLMLFAIAMASGAGYLVVSAESRMARHSGESEEALAIARGGLNRFVSEQLGVVADSARYAMGNGEAAVSARRVAEVDEFTHMYFVRSAATVPDPLAQGSPSRRVVGAYAYHRRRPLPLHGALVLSVADISVENPAEVSGDDAGGAVCPGGAQPSITGAIAREGVAEDGTLEGSPEYELWPGGYAQFMNQVALRWDILTDPSFPVDFEDVRPPFSTLPADSFPVVRLNGSPMLNPSWSGRGVLIVTEEFRAVPSFSWEGIVLAGWVDDRVRGSIDGMLVGGFSGTEPYDEIEVQGTIRYHSCNVDRANASLSYLELVDDAVFEID
ncbi:MAG: hypothetical protein U5R14_01350 [Gemmatimonadota bacterium]|nr:hypothetical protein [Gemmatimonadota bacterium]